MRKLSQFDQTTECKAEMTVMRLYGLGNREELVGYEKIVATAKECRNSAKTSLEIMAQACERIEKAAGHGSVGACRMWAKEAIAAVKAKGDWPLEDR